MNNDIARLEDWGFPVNKTFLITGPCAAESEEQVMKTAEGLVPLKPTLFRAGIWKPRTRPNTFEGVGAKGLKWLKKVKNEFGMAVTTEVATPDHVQACLDNEIDMVWVGARTTVNPFAVQAIADALEGVDIPVLVKNSINPDLELWLGGIERIMGAGVKKIGAIHRGFSVFEKCDYRNDPKWRIPIELKRRLPALPVICDPSHISGVRALVPKVAQKALDLLFDGLMIESHIDPDVALSDSKQQFTPADMIGVMDNLAVRDISCTDCEFAYNIDKLRQNISKMDDQLMKLMSERMGVAREIGELKVKNNVAVLQPSRWKEIITERVKQGEDLQLSEHFVKRLFQYIHQESIRHQEIVAGVEPSQPED